MIIGNVSSIENAVDLTQIGISFSSKPIIHGGTAIEYEKFKVISFERLFFLKTFSYKYQPEVRKLTDDFELIVEYYNETFRNKNYVENASKHIKKYESVPNGIILNDNY